MGNHSRSQKVSEVPSREELLKGYFWGRTDVFAQWNQDISEWQCIRRDIPQYLIKCHIEGKIAIATYPVNSLGNTPHLCFDLDSKTAEAYGILDWLQGWFKARDMLFLIEDTGGRGLHGWVLFLCYVPAVKAIGLASLALDVYKHFNSELSKAAALAVNLRNQADYFGPRNRGRRLQRFFTEAPSLLNTSAGSLLGIKAVSCHANVG